MRWLGDRIWTADGPREGSVRVDTSGTVRSVDDQPARDREAQGLVVPAPVNAHTHLADRSARGLAEGLTLEEAVAPPDGLKHRFLREQDPEALEASFAEGLSEVEASGALRVLDFREQGPAGARVARKAARQRAVEVTLLGRPTEPDRWEDQAPELRGLVDGIGISGLGDQPPATTEEQAAWCREHGKTLALHISEGEREDVGAALSLEPDLLVHGTCLSGADIQAVANAAVPLVLCPRSNALFGQAPPVDGLIDAGVPLGLGTDNAMFHPADVWHEVAFLVRELDVDPLAAVSMAVGFSLPDEPDPRVDPGERVVLIDDTDGLLHAIEDERIHVPWREPIARNRS